MPSKQYTMGKNKRKGVDLTLPSGETCLVRRPSPQALMGAGVLDSFDSLTALVGAKLNEIDGKAEVSPEALQKLAAQKENLEKALGMADKVVEYVVLEPRCYRPVERDEYGKPILKDGKEIPLSDDRRDPNKLYTDDVDLEDRMFIMQFAVGGSADLNTFRSGTEEIVGAVEALEGVRSPAKRTSRR